METQQVLVGDAFASEPLGGMQIAILPDGGELTDSQQRAIARELGTAGTVTLVGDALEYVSRFAGTSFIEAGVAGCIGLFDRGELDVGEYDLTVTGADTTAVAQDHTVTIDADRQVTIECRGQQLDETGVDIEELATVLDIDVNTIMDIGADLPPGRVIQYGGTVLLPVNFLQHLSGATVDCAGLKSLLTSADAARLFAFTFDTLSGTSDIHARIFEPFRGRDELVTSGVGAAACGAQIASSEAFDGEKGSITIESGHFLDRPANLEVDVAHAPTVRGSGLLSVDGTITVPGNDSADDIIEI